MEVGAAPTAVQWEAAGTSGERVNEIWDADCSSLSGGTARNRYARVRPAFFCGCAVPGGKRGIFSDRHPLQKSGFADVTFPAGKTNMLCK